MLFSLILAFSLLVQSAAADTTVKNDSALIVPGKGAEKVLLSENAESVIKAMGYPEKVSEFKKEKDLFRHVFNVDSPVKIKFNKIYYYEKKKAVIFLLNNTVTGIAGLGSSRITSDSVDLRKGIEYFIFIYGNNKLYVLVKSNDKKGDKIYLYPEIGIALVDDGDDDAVDMYLVFERVKN